MALAVQLACAVGPCFLASLLYATAPLECVEFCTRCPSLSLPLPPLSPLALAFLGLPAFFLFLTLAASLLRVVQGPRPRYGLLFYAAHVPGFDLERA